MEFPNATEKPKPVIVSPEKGTVLTHHNAADCADFIRDVINLINELHRILLVWNSQITASKSKRVHCPERGADLSRLDCERQITPGETLLIHPKFMHHRRTRMHDRPPHYSRQAKTFNIAHEMAPSNFALK